MSRLDKLRKAKSLSDFAYLIGYEAKAVSFILYIIPDDQKYTEFLIPKKNGDARRIHAPVEKLKLLQKRLAGLLNECYEEIFTMDRKKSLSHGFRKRHSIITNAKSHVNKRYVFNIDLENFFPSINFGRVRGYFIKNRYFELDPKVATIIAQIACNNNELPQGSPCSPIISNMLGHLLDIRLVNLAKREKCTYSRYADDLTFSTNKKQFPENIAIEIEENKWIAGESLIKEIENVGFKVNSKKTSMQYRIARQLTTGLVVNKKINIRKEYYKKARSMCHELFKTGQFYIDKDCQGNRINGNINQLEGILSFIYQVKRPHDKRSLGARRNKPNAITKLYRDFLFYKHFFNAQTPIIITEGKTDIIYLQVALKQLSSEYSEYTEINGNATNYKIKFLNMSESFLDVFAISRGSSGLRNIIDIYARNMKKYKGEGKKNPIIMIVDNDEGSKEIKNILKNEQSQNNAFYFINDNLYVLLVPKNGGSIEDLFDESTLNTELNGKSFSREAKIDQKKEYGKHVFAQKVIQEKQEHINFDGFKEVFDNLSDIINDYLS